MSLNFENLKHELKKLKVKEDFIIIHSDLHKHKIILENLDKFWQTILNSFGKDKTYIIPTFTTSFVRKKIWDYNKTKSQTGVFSEYFRIKIAEKRSEHPIHSVAIWGKKKMKFQFINQNQVLEKALCGNGYANLKMCAIYLLVLMLTEEQQSSITRKNLIKSIIDI